MSGVAALVLPVAGDLYALPLEQVREVVAAPKVTRLATAPAVVLGLFNLRGQIIALFDTAALMGIGAVETAMYAVVVDCEHGPVALAANGFPQRAVLETSIAPSELPGTAGLYQLDGQVAALLDPSALLTPERVGGQDLRTEHVGVGQA